MAKLERALISVSDKTGIVEFARELQRLGVEIISTGGTSKLLKENGVRVVEISEHTGFPEIMDGRVKIRRCTADCLPCGTTKPTENR